MQSASDALSALSFRNGVANKCTLLLCVAVQFLYHKHAYHGAACDSISENIESAADYYCIIGALWGWIVAGR